MSKENTEGEKRHNLDSLLKKYPDGFHFGEVELDHGTVELHYENSFVEMFSISGINPDRLDRVIQDFLNKEGLKAS